MKFVQDEKLHILADSISDELLRKCLDTLGLQYSWRMSSNANFQEIAEVNAWCTNKFYYLKENAALCVIHKIRNKEIYSTFVVINPNFLFQLEPELRRILNLKAFL